MKNTFKKYILLGGFDGTLILGESNHLLTMKLMRFFFGGEIHEQRSG